MRKCAKGGIGRRRSSFLGFIEPRLGGWGLGAGRRNANREGSCRGAGNDCVAIGQFEVRAGHIAAERAVEQRIAGLIGNRFERLHFQRGGEGRRCFIAVVPGNRAGLGLRKHVGRFDHRRGRSMQSPGGIQLFVSECARLASPVVGSRPDLDRRGRGTDNMNYRRVGIDKNRQCDFAVPLARGDLANAVAEAKFLPERVSGLERIRSQRDPHAADFQQP